MELRNPLFKSMDKDTYEGTEAVCTIHGTFGKTLFLVLIAVAAAIGSIVLLNGIFGATSDAELEQKLMTYVGLLIGSLVGVIIFGIIANLSTTLCPVFSVLFSVAMGFLLGSISGIADLAYPGIALIAIVLTLAVTLTMGILYFTGVIKVGHKFKAFILTSLIGLVVGSATLGILAACNVPGMRELLTSSPLGWFVDIFAAIIAALSLCVDFDYAAGLADREADKKYEWKAAFCLSSSILYLYLRILYLLMRVAAAAKK